MRWRERKGEVRWSKGEMRAKLTMNTNNFEHLFHFAETIFCKSTTEEAKGHDSRQCAAVPDTTHLCCCTTSTMASSCGEEESNDVPSHW